MVLLAFAGALLGAAVLVFDIRAVTAAVLALGLIVMTFRFLFAGVLVYLLVAMIRPEELGISPVIFRLQLLLALACLAAQVLPKLAAGRRQSWLWSGTDRALAALFLAALASIPLSLSRLGAAASFWEFGKLGFAYVLIRGTATSLKRTRVLVWTLLAGVCITALLGLYGWSAGKVYLGEAGITRAAGLTSAAGDPNTLANTLVAGLPLMVLLLVASPGRGTKIVLAAMACLSLSAIALTGARAALVSLAVAVLLLTVRVGKRALWLVPLSAALLAAVWVKLPADLQQRYLTIGRYQSEVTYQSRITTARVGLEMLRDHPLTGVGLGGFQVARLEEYDRVWLQPHNLYVQVASEMGLFGLIAFAAFLISLVRTCRRTRRLLPGAGLDPVDRRWMDHLCSAILIMLAALLCQGLAGHNFGRWDYYVSAALAANCLQIAAGAVGRTPSADPPGHSG